VIEHGPCEWHQAVFDVSVLVARLLLRGQLPRPIVLCGLDVGILLVCLDDLSHAFLKENFSCSQCVDGVFDGRFEIVIGAKDVFWCGYYPFFVPPNSLDQGQVVAIHMYYLVFFGQFPV
jgi:hypothetical protein